MSTLQRRVCVCVCLHVTSVGVKWNNCAYTLSTPLLLDAFIIILLHATCVLATLVALIQAVSGKRYAGKHDMAQAGHTLLHPVKKFEA